MIFCGFRRYFGARRQACTVRAEAHPEFHLTAVAIRRILLSALSSLAMCTANGKDLDYSQGGDNPVGDRAAIADFEHHGTEVRGDVIVHAVVFSFERGCQAKSVRNWLTLLAHVQHQVKSNKGEQDAKEAGRGTSITPG